MAQASQSSAADLSQRARQSSLVTLLGYGGANLLRLLSNVLLARMLFPEDFGTMGLLLLLVQGLAMFADVGTGPSVVHSARGEDPAFLNTAFTVQVLRGLVLWGAAVLVAPYWAAALGKPEILPYANVATFTAVLAGFNSTRIYTAERKVAVARRVACDLAAQGASVATMLAWAYLSPGVWALVAGSLTHALVYMVLSHVVLPGHRNRLQWEHRAAVELFGFGRWIFFSTALAFLASQMDRLLLGKKLGTDGFGVYWQALAIAGLPQVVGGILAGTVLYPVLAEAARTSRAELQTRFERSRALLLDASVVAALAVALASPPFFRLLYREEYHDAAWIAPMFVLSLWFSLLQMSADRVCLALGRPRVLALSNGASLLGKLVGGVAGFQLWGLPGFLVGLTVGTIAGHFVVRQQLAQLGLPLGTQDRRATLRLLSIGAVPVLLPYALGGDLFDALSVGLQGVQRSALEIALGAAVLAPLSLRLVARLRGRS